MRDLKLLRVLFLVLVCTMVLHPVSMAEEVDTSTTADGIESADGLVRIEPVWIRKWQDKGGDQANAWDVMVHENRVYAAGLIGTSNSPKVAPLIIQCYTLDGELVWERRWEGFSGKYGTGAAAAVMIGHGPYLYVGGAVARDEMNASLIQKWDTDGNLIWTEFWGKPNGGHHEVNGLAIVDNYLYVSHYSSEEHLTTIDAVIKKFDIKKLDARKPQSESLIWSKTYGKPNSHNTTDGHIYADETGVYICGQHGGPKGPNVYIGGDAYLAKFDPDGNQQWLKVWEGDGTGCDDAFNLTSDGKHIFMTGPTFTSSEDSLLGFDIQVFVQKYTMDGNLIWTKLFGGPKTEYSRGIAADDKHVFVVLTTKSYVDVKDNTVVLKYDKESGALVGKRIWGGKGFDGATTSLAIGDPGYLYLSGNSSSSEDGEDTEKLSAVVMKITK